MQKKLQKIQKELKKKQHIAVVFAILLVSPMLVTPAHAELTIKQVIVVRDIYPADTAVHEFTFDPPVDDLTKSFVFMSFAHDATNDHSDTFRSWEFVNENTVRIKGESTATGNNPLEFTAYIVEYNDSVVAEQVSRTFTPSEAEGEKSVTINSINTTNSFIIPSGHHHNASETTVANEEYDRYRILTSTTAGILIGNTPNTGDQGNHFQIVDLNSDDINVQRGTTTIAGGSTTATISPPTDVDRTRSILIVSNACTTGCDTSDAVDDMNVRATLDTSSPPDIIITRVGTEDTVDIAWEIIEDKSGKNFAVEHQSFTLGAGTFNGTDTVASVRDFDKTLVISTSTSPFGFGSGSSSLNTDGEIDAAQATLTLVDNDEVFIDRNDSSGTMIIEYQIVELLEPVYGENPQGTNVLRQITMIEDTFTAGETSELYAFPTPLANVSKTMSFVSVRFGNVEQIPEVAKSWKILNTTHFKMYGTSDPIHSNIEVPFVATFVEFDSNSPIFVQQDQVQYTSDTVNNAKNMTISPINTTNAFSIYQGFTMSGGTDPSFGMEEMVGIRILDETTWEFEPDTIQDTLETTLRNEIVDLGQDNISVQRGQDTLSGTSLSISPPSSVDDGRSLFFVSYLTTGGDFITFPTNSSILAYLDSSGDIQVERSTTGDDIIINWEVVEFPPNLIASQHGFHNQTAGITATNQTIVPVGNFSQAFAIGTVVNPFGQGTGAGNSTTPSGFNSTVGTIELKDTDEIEFMRGASDGDWAVGWQVFELITQQDFDRSLVEDHASEDDIDRQLSIARTLTEDHASEDLLDRVAGFMRDLVEEHASEDDLTGIIGYMRSLIEDHASEDLLDRIAGFNRDLFEEHASEDSIDRMLSFMRTLTEDHASEDDLDRMLSFMRTLTEDHASEDEVDEITMIMRSLIEDHASEDIVERIAGYMRTVTEDHASEDLLDRMLTFMRDLSEEHASEDLLDRVSIFNRALEEEHASEDAVTKVTTYLRILFEDHASEDAIDRMVTYIRGLTEDHASEDVLNRTVGFIRNLTEEHASEDLVNRVVNFFRGLFEDHASEDLIDFEANFTKTFTEDHASEDSVVGLCSGTCPFVEIPTGGGGGGGGGGGHDGTLPRISDEFVINIIAEEVLLVPNEYIPNQNLFLSQLLPSLFGQTQTVTDGEIFVSWNSDSDIEITGIVTDESEFIFSYPERPFQFSGDVSGQSLGETPLRLAVDVPFCSEQVGVDCIEYGEYTVPAQITIEHEGQTFVKPTNIPIKVFDPLPFFIFWIGIVFIILIAIILIILFNRRRKTKKKPLTIGRESNQRSGTTVQKLTGASPIPEGVTLFMVGKGISKKKANSILNSLRSGKKPVDKGTSDSMLGKNGEKKKKRGSTSDSLKR